MSKIDVLKKLYLTISRTNNGKIKISTYSILCNNKKNRFIKEQEAKGLIISLG